MATVRKSRTISNQQDIGELVSYKASDLTQSKILSLVGEFGGKPPRFYPYDLFEVPKGVYGPEGQTNKNSFMTTVGIWLFNVYFIEDELFQWFHYVNKTIDAGAMGDIVDELSTLVVEDKAPLNALTNFLHKTQKWMPLTTVITPGSTEKIYRIGEYINPIKKKMYQKYKKELDSGDVVVAEKVEKELTQMAADYLKDDPSMDIYNSKARSSIGNHFKNMYIMKGTLKDPDPNAKQGYNVIMSSLNDGVSKEEYPVLCKSLSSGPYSRAQKTAIGGYWEKLFVMAYQDILIGKVGSDCGTKQTLSIKLDKSNIGAWLYSYIKEGDHYVELTSENRDKYIGKTVNFRFSSLCESKTCICHRCAGNGFNRLNVKQVGVAMGMIASKIKNINMKAFHDGTVSTYEIDPKVAFGE